MSKSSILIVEDEAIIRADIAAKLQKLGYDVAGETETGEEAVELARRARPSLVLMDIRLAGAMDGIAAAEAIQRESRMPVVFLTAHSDDITIRRARQADAFGFILKPFEERELATQIEMTLYKHAAEQRLRRSESRLREVLENSLDAAYKRNLLTKSYDYLSPVFTRISGYSPDEMSRLTIESMRALIHPDDQPEVERVISRSKSGSPGAANRMEYRFKHKNGHYIWLHNQFTVMRDANGHPTASIGIVRDITDRKRDEAERAGLEARNMQLQKAESLGRMAGAVAHHFNNQFHVVMGNLEMAMGDLMQGANSLQHLASAMKATQKASQVSSLMLTYLGQTPGKQSALDLSEFCRRSRPLLQAAAAKDMTLTSDISASGPIILGNAGQIMQVLTSLITNALESAGGKKIDIGLSVKTVPAADIPPSRRFPIDWRPEDADYACMEVSDAGGGIAENDMDKIFDPFFTTKFTGRGMGLAAVLGIVRAHQGAVTVESEPGKGSVFRVFFPVLLETVPRRPDNSARVLKPKGSGTVLVVEDEDMVRMMISDILRHAGFTVLEANDGVEAVDVFRSHQDEIRCVLSDLAMPRMDGWETLTALRRLSPDIPVILSSGYNEAHVMAGAHPERPNAFLEKPYRLQDLEDIMHRTLAPRRQ